MSTTGDVDKAVAADLLQRERMLLDPAVRRDREQVAALLAADFTEIGSSGRVWSREEILHLLATEDYSAPELENFTCRALGDGVVLVTYETVRTDATTGKRSVTLRSSIWSLQSGEWRVRFHQGTRMP